MSTAYVALGYRCNSNCLTCPIDPALPRARPVSAGVIKRFLLQRTSYEAVTFSGGEPTLHPQLSSLAQWCADQFGARIEILTSARSLGRGPLVDRLAQVPRLQLTTAMYAPDETSHDALSGSPGSFRETCDGLRRALDRRIRVVLKTVVSRRNYRELELLFRTMIERFPEVEDFVIYGTDWTGAARENLASLFVPNAEVAPYLEDAVLAIQEAGRRAQVRLFPLCLLDPALWEFAAHPDPNDAAGDVLFSPESAALDFEVDAGRVQAVCQSCALRRVCGRTWDSYFEVGGVAELRPIVLEGWEER